MKIWSTGGASCRHLSLVHLFDLFIFPGFRISAVRIIPQTQISLRFRAAPFLTCLNFLPANDICEQEYPEPSTLVWSKRELFEEAIFARNVPSERRSAMRRSPPWSVLTVGTLPFFIPIHFCITGLCWPLFLGTFYGYVAPTYCYSVKK